MNNSMNVVCIVMDHIAYYQYETFYKNLFKLSNLERMRQNGISFSNAYSVEPICSPARASMITGVYPHKHGITRNDSKSERQIPNETYPYYNRYLDEQGYLCGWFGKWHAQHDNRYATDYGFEGFSMSGYGHPYKSDLYKEYLSSRGLDDPKVSVEWGMGIGRSQGENPVYNLCGIERFAGRSSNGYVTASCGTIDNFQQHEAYFLSHMAVNWLKQRNIDKKQFALRVDSWGPHQPYCPGEPFKNSIEPHQIKPYPNFKNNFHGKADSYKKFRESCIKQSKLKTWEEWQPVMERVFENMIQVDAALGQIIDYIENSGLSKNTAIILTADHGDAVGVAGGLFDKGALMIEEVMKIPLIIKYPDNMDSGRVIDSYVSNLDTVPTILGLAGANIPEHMDGINLDALIKNKVPPRSYLICEHYGHLGYDDCQKAIYFDDWKAIFHHTGEHELYNLLSDPYEKENLFLSKQHNDIRLKMVDLLCNVMNQYNDLSNNLWEDILHI